jgi:NADH-quinone oxidoreductase subunit N
MNGGELCIVQPFQPWSSLAPQLALAAGIVAALCAGMMERVPRALLRAIALSVILAAAFFAAATNPALDAGPLIRLDGLGLAWQMLFYVGALPLAVLLRADDEVPLALFLGCALGMGLLAASGNLLMLFLGLEFMSLPAYLLVARGGGRSASSREAAVKYFFAGSTAGALFLLGMALYYADARTLALIPASGPLVELGLALMGSAALFKIGAVPLHFWLPDAYEAAAPEVAGFLSTSMKSAGVLLVLRIAALAPGSAFARSLPAFGALTMVAGALLALRQQKLQRLLAYSSVSHAGFVLLGAGAWAAQGAPASGAAAVYFYLAAYLFMSNGAFVFLRASGLSTRAELRGYARREPRLAALFAALMLSLGGVPPTAGFLAKLFVLWEAAKAGLYGAALAGAFAALVSLGYYLALVRDAWFEEPEGELPQAALAPHTAADRIVLLTCAIPAALLGAAPWIVGGLGGALGR